MVILNTSKKILKIAQCIIGVILVEECIICNVAKGHHSILTGTMGTEIVLVQIQNIFRTGILKMMVTMMKMTMTMMMIIDGSKVDNNSYFLYDFSTSDFDDEQK